MVSSRSNDGKLTKKTLFFFGLTEMPLQVAIVPIVTFIPNYYVQDLGLSAALVGLAMGISRLFDGITDPLIGYFSDRTQSRWGRRRIWMIAGVPLAMLGAYMAFFPGPEPTVAYLFWWMLVLWLGWTMIFIPYYAWAAELTPDYNERSMVTGWRTALGLVANVVSKIIPTVALVYFGYGGTPAVVTMIGLMLLFLLPTTVGLTSAMVPESTAPPPKSTPVWAGLRIMMRNGPFKRLIAAFFVNYLGTAISTATIVFFIRGVLGEEKAGIAILLAYYLVSLCSIPFWVWISTRIGKHRAWCSALIAFACINPLYFFLGPGDVMWMIPIIAMTGFCGGTFHTMTNSMKADVIDLDTLQSGENRAGLYFATWSLAIKAALVLGPIVGLGLLGLFGYESAPGLVEDPVQRLVLQCVFILGPPIFFTAAAAIAWNYPITEARHIRLRDALKRRQARRLATAE